MQTLRILAHRLLRRPEPLRTIVVPVPLFAAYGELARQLQACLPHRHSERTMHDLLYVADVLHLVRNGRRMFANEFVATMSGPALQLLREYQDDDEGVALLMHDAHQEIVDDEMRAVIADVVRKLGHANRDTIRPYAQNSESAWGRLFMRHFDTMTSHKGPSITEEMMRAEALRRYPSHKIAAAA